MRRREMEFASRFIITLHNMLMDNRCCANSCKKMGKEAEFKALREGAYPCHLCIWQLSWSW